MPRYTDTCPNCEAEFTAQLGYDEEVVSNRERLTCDCGELDCCQNCAEDLNECAECCGYLCSECMEEDEEGEFFCRECAAERGIRHAA